MIASTKQITNIKNNIISSIINTAEIVDAIGANPDEQLVYNHIYPTMRIPDVESEKKTCICMKVDISGDTGRNTTVRTATIVLMVLTHQDLQRVDTGIAKGNVRTDFISEQLEMLFDQNTDMGFGQARLVSNLEDSIDARHQCRLLRFETFISSKSLC